MPRINSICYDSIPSYPYIPLGLAIIFMGVLLPYIALAPQLFKEGNIAPPSISLTWRYLVGRICIGIVAIFAIEFYGILCLADASEKAWVISGSLLIFLVAIVNSDIDNTIARMHMILAFLLFIIAFICSILLLVYEYTGTPEFPLGMILTILLGIIFLMMIFSYTLIPEWNAVTSHYERLFLGIFGLLLMGVPNSIRV